MQVAPVREGISPLTGVIADVSSTPRLRQFVLTLFTPSLRLSFFRTHDDNAGDESYY
jgi:hypothetical protein